MDPKLVIDAIEKVVLTMKDESDEWEQWRNYATVSAMARDLQSWAELLERPPQFLVSEQLRHVMSGAAGLARLSEQQERDQEWHVQTALRGISALRHPNLFGRG